MRRILIFALLTSLSFLSCSKTSRQQMINVAEYGITANSGENITVKINELIEGIEGETTIVFPTGRYDFFPDSAYFRNYHESNTYDINPKRLAILIREKKGITLDGQGSEFVYHGHIQPITVDNSSNITLKNISVDWDKPLTAEAKVIESDSSKILIEIDIDQFPYRVTEEGLIFSADDWEADWKLSDGGWRLMEFDTNYLVAPNTGDKGSVRGDLKNVHYKEAGRGRVLMEGNFKRVPAVGHHLVLRHSTRDHAGIFLYHSKDLTLENIAVYHTSGLGILSQYCENITMHKVDMIPNPSKKRVLSSHDDGLHFMGCKGKILIDDCDAQGLMDDPINIHGTCVPVTRRLSETSVSCEFAHDMSEGMLWAQPGDTIGVIDKQSMNTIDHLVVKDFRLLDKKNFTLEFSSAGSVAIDERFSLENLSWTPEVTIRNCDVGSNRARGYLITTPRKVLVENNRFSTSGSAILIAGDANYWFESGAVNDLTIRNNVFEAPCNSSYYQFGRAIISIFPEIPQVDPLKPYHKNIRIEGNEFNPSDYPVLYAKSVDGLSFISNRIERSFAYEPWHPNQNTFLFEACRKVVIKDNVVGQEVLGKTVRIKHMSEEELILGDTSLQLID